MRLAFTLPCPHWLLRCLPKQLVERAERWGIAKQSWRWGNDKANASVDVTFDTRRTP